MASIPDEPIYASAVFSDSVTPVLDEVTPIDPHDVPLMMPSVPAHSSPITNNSKLSSSKSRSLLNFPTELIVHVLKMLPIPDLVKVRQVSSALNHLILSSRCLWKYTEVQFVNHWKHWMLVHRLLQAQIKFIQSLKLNYVRDDVVHEHIPLFYGLAELEISGWFTLSCYSFHSLRQHRHPGIVFQPKMPNLRTFTISHYELTYCSIGCKSLYSIIRNAPKLQTLHIWCNLQLSHGLTQYIGRTLPTLQRLSLSSMAFHNGHDFVAALAPLKQLKYLAMSHVVNLNDLTIERMAQSLPNLETLVLHASSLLTDSGIRSLISQCHQLTTIKFYDCPNVSLVTMYELGFESVLETPNVLHRPCFPIGMGMGFVRVSK